MLTLFSTYYTGTCFNAKHHCQGVSLYRHTKVTKFIKVKLTVLYIYIYIAVIVMK
jgi:hypothetical protein